MGNSIASNLHQIYYRAMSRVLKSFDRKTVLFNFNMDQYSTIFCLQTKSIAHRLKFNPHYSKGWAEHQVTQGRKTFALPDLFLVMATQNPIEQEGTYPLPEAQLDRFLMHVRVGYPLPQKELEILKIARDEVLQIDSPPPLTLDQEEIFVARKEISELYMAEAIERYIVSLVTHTRER